MPNKADTPKRSKNLVCLGNGTYYQIVALLEQRFELSGMFEIRIRWTVTHFNDGNHSNNRKQTESTTKCRTATNKLLIFRKPGNVLEEFRKRNRKEQERQNKKQINEG